MWIIGHRMLTITDNCLVHVGECNIADHGSSVSGH